MSITYDVHVLSYTGSQSTSRSLIFFRPLGIDGNTVIVSNKQLKPGRFTLHGPIGMDGRVVHLGPRTSHEDGNLLSAPPMDPRQRRHGGRLEGVSRVDVVPLAQELVLLVLWPWVGRPLEVRVDNGGKANFDHDVLDVLVGYHGSAHLLGCVVEELVPDGELVLGQEGIVVRLERDVDFLDLDEASRLKVAFGVSHKR